MPEGSYAFSVGSIRCTALSDGYYSYPAEWFFANVEPERLRRAFAERRLPPNDVLSPYTCLLIENGRHVVLFDTGAGQGSATTGAILARLEMAGIRPKDVDTVVLSHVHPDHIGGAVNAIGKPMFPNARCMLLESEWNFWTGWRTDLRAMDVPDRTRQAIAGAGRRCLAGLRFQVELLAGETEIVPGVWAVPAPGHTPGHLALLLDGGQDGLLAFGDAALHPIHLEEPEWHNALDLAAEVAAATRRTLLERAVAEGLRVMGFHFPFPSVGRVCARGSHGWDWAPGW